MRVFKWLILSRFKALMRTVLFLTWIFLCLSAKKNKILVRMGNENDFSGG
jgi:preprotein translocase subunit SecG